MTVNLDRSQLDYITKLGYLLSSRLEVIRLALFLSSTVL